MKQQWPLLRSFIFANKNVPSPFHLYVQVMYDHFQNAAHQEMSSILKIVEIMLVFSMSTAAVERSFSTYNLIVTVLRNALTQGAKEKLMHISSTSPSVADLNGSEVLSYWKELSKKEDVKLFGYSIAFLLFTM